MNGSLVEEEGIKENLPYSLFAKGAFNRYISLRCLRTGKAFPEKFRRAELLRGLDMDRGVKACLIEIYSLHVNIARTPQT